MAGSAETKLTSDDAKTPQATQSPDSPSPRNPVNNSDLGHSSSSFDHVKTLLSGDLEEGHRFEEREVEEFGKESGDDQGIHFSDDPRVLTAFHLESSGIMSEDTGFFMGLDEDSAEEALEQLDYNPRRIVQGAYSTAKVISQLPELVEGQPVSLSASHSSPVRYASDEQRSDFIRMEKDAAEADIPLVKYDRPEEGVNESEGEVYAEHNVLSETEEEIDYELMGYALAKGMSFDDRNGDVLFGFPEINFTTYDRENLEELKMGERRIVESPDELEHRGEEVFGRAEAMEQKMQDLIGEDVEVNVYNNVVEDQEGETVLEYTEVDLQGVEYKEDFSSPVAEFSRSLMELGMTMNPFVPYAASD